MGRNTWKRWIFHPIVAEMGKGNKHNVGKSGHTLGSCMDCCRAEKTNSISLRNQYFLHYWYLSQITPLQCAGFVWRYTEELGYCVQWCKIHEGRERERGKKQLHFVAQWHSHSHEGLVYVPDVVHMFYSKTAQFSPGNRVWHCHLQKGRTSHKVPELHCVLFGNPLSFLP